MWTSFSTDLYRFILTPWSETSPCMVIIFYQRFFLYQTPIKMRVTEDIRVLDGP